jgi:AraC-like DNA-binding protein
MDVLNDICSSLRLRAELYFHAALDAPFAVRLPEEERHIRFHHMLSGCAYVAVPGQPAVALNPGDMVLVPEGASQILSSDAAARDAIPLEAVLAAHPVEGDTLRVGHGAPDCQILCGYLGFDPGILHPILSVLPPVILLKHDDETCGSALQLLRDEALLSGPGAFFVLHRIVEILLIQSLRREATAGRSANPYMEALCDPSLAKCLRAIHAEPARNWSVDILARHVGLSRSVLSARFSSKVGMGPSAYLTLWRMTKAREMLIDTRLPIADIAERCGYASLPAFNRRFTTIFGIGPGQWRKQNNGAYDSSARRSAASLAAEPSRLQRAC